MSPRAPNILLIIADDFGVHQLGCTTPGGAGFFRTPHLDRLAAEGVRFTCAYATAPVCLPPQLMKTRVNSHNNRLATKPDAVYDCVVYA